MRILRQAVLLTAIFLATPPHAAQLAPRTPIRMADLLQREVAIHWQGISLREACRRLADTQGLALFLDRRIDAEQPINLQARGKTLQVVVAELAEQGGGKLALLPSLCYLGPTETSQDLPTLIELAREQMNALPAATRRKLAQKLPLRWQRLATPQHVLRDLTQPLGLKLSGAELLPHDLWNAGALPEATVAEQLALLLAGFDLTWRWEQDAINIVPIDHPVRIARSYAWRGVTAARLQQVGAEMPAANLRLSNNQVVLDGRVEDHEKLLGILSQLTQPQRSARRSKRPAPQRKLYSLRLESQPTGAVLRELARQLELELHVDNAALSRANRSLDTRISVTVTQVDLDALLEEIGNAAGLAITPTDTELSVAPR